MALMGAVPIPHPIPPFPTTIGMGLPTALHGLSDDVR
jgi:hypothetical protein